MAKKKHLSQYDSAGNRQEIYLNDDEVMTGGKTLVDKLAEMEQSIDDAAGKADTAVQDAQYVHTDNNYTDADKAKVGGMKAVATSGSYNDLNDKPTIPAAPDAALSDTSENAVQNKVVKAAIDSLRSALDTLIGSGNVQGAIDTFNEVKAFLNGIDMSDPTLANQLLALNNAISAVQTSLAGKVNTADVYTKTEVDDKVANAGKVKSVSVNGTNHTPDSSGVVDLGTIQGEKGDKGDQGDTVLISETSQEFAGMIVNDVTTGGGDKALSAEMGKRLKAKVDEVEANIQRLYNNLGNIAFWDAAAKSAAAPIPIDWGNPKHNVTLNLSLTNAVVTHNGVAVTNGSVIQVEEFGKLTLIVEPSSSSHELSSVTSSTTGAVVTDLLNGTYKVEITMGNTDITLSVVAVATMPLQVSFKVSNDADALSISKSTVSVGGTFVGQVAVVDDYYDGVSIVSVKDSSDNDVPYSFSDNTITIANVTDDITITAKATKHIKYYPNKARTPYGGVSDLQGCCFTEPIKLKMINSNAPLKWWHGYSAGTNAGKVISFMCNSQKKYVWHSEPYDAKWNPYRMTNNSRSQNQYREWPESTLQGAINTAGGTVYFMDCFILDNGLPPQGLELVQGETNFLDGVVFVAADDLVVHNISYSGDGASCAIDMIAQDIPLMPNIIHGMNFETLITVDSGKTLQSVVVTMGGVNISDDHPEWKTNKKIVIDSVTGDLDITVTAS